MPPGTPDPEWILQGGRGPVTALLFLHPDPKPVLLVATQTGYISVWSLETRRQLQVIHAHPEESILWLHQTLQKSVLSQGRDGWLHWWDHHGNQWEKTDSYEYSSKGFCPCECLENTEGAGLLAVPTEESIVKVLSMATKETMVTLTPSSGNRAYGMCMSIKKCTVKNNVHILVGYEDGSVGLWDTKHGHELLHTSLHTEPIMCIDYCDILNKGFSGSTDSNVKMWAITDALEAPRVVDIDVTNGGVNCVRFRTDGKLFVAGGSDGRARMFSKSRRKLAILECHRDSIQALAFDTSNTLAVGSKDSSVSIWKLY